MNKFTSIIMLSVIPLLFSCAADCAGRWQSYAFDGNEFNKSNDTSSIRVKPGFLPQLEDQSAITRLAKGNGAVAGLCYMRVSGGKLTKQRTIAPLPDTEIKAIKDGKVIATATSNRNGFYTMELASGDYELDCRGIRLKLNIKSGETSLLSIMGGKRLVD